MISSVTSFFVTRLRQLFSPLFFSRARRSAMDPFLPMDSWSGNIWKDFELKLCNQRHCTVLISHLIVIFVGRSLINARSAFFLYIIQSFQSFLQRFCLLRNHRVAFALCQRLLNWSAKVSMKREENSNVIISSYFTALNWNHVFTFKREKRVKCWFV